MSVEGIRMEGLVKVLGEGKIIRQKRGDSKRGGCGKRALAGLRSRPEWKER